MSARVDLSRLNAAEREVLALLAQGHTVKSIAALTDRSVGAVNERLREARRKTGVGSSRELARTLRIAGDEQIGMAVGDGSAQSPPAGDVRRSSRKGPIMAVILASLTAAIALLASQSAPPHDTPSDPRLARLLDRGQPTPQALHDRLAAERRDATWATAKEAAIRARYATIDGLADDLRVRCARTLCEIVGTIAPAIDRDQARANRVMQELQGGGLHTDMSALGFADGSQSFGGGDRLEFVAYWERRYS